MAVEQPAPRSLDFQEKLVQSGKRENTDALLKRLKVGSAGEAHTHTSLSISSSLRWNRTMSTSSRSTLFACPSSARSSCTTRSASDLSHTHYQSRTDDSRGVKAYAACCIADILRLYAPDAPYTNVALRVGVIDVDCLVSCADTQDIFQFFAVQLDNLRPSPVKPLQPSRSKSNLQAESAKSQSSASASQRVTDVAYYTEYCYLLESLATIKSIVIACDVPGGDAITTSYFQSFCEIVRWVCLC